MYNLKLMANTILHTLGWTAKLIVSPNLETRLEYRHPFVPFPLTFR